MCGIRASRGSSTSVLDLPSARSLSTPTTALRLREGFRIPTTCGRRAPAAHVAGVAAFRWLPITVAGAQALCLHHRAGTTATNMKVHKQRC